MINPIDPPYNAIVCYKGRLVELMYLAMDLQRKEYGFWGIRLTPNCKKRLKLREKVLKHIEWYVKKRLPELPTMYWQQFRSGFLLYNANDYKLFK